MSKAREIADERLAKGEISPREHAQLLETLKTSPDRLTEDDKNVVDETDSHKDSLRAAAGGTAALVVCYYLFDNDGSIPLTGILITAVLIFGIIYVAALAYFNSRKK